MSSLVRTIRFVVGLSLLTAGVIAAGPYVTRLVAAHQRSAPPAPPPATPAWVSEAAQGAPPVGFEPAGDTAAQEARMAAVGHGLAAEETSMPASAPFVPRSDYRPPAPPAALPPVVADFTRSAPPLEPVYRSTVDVPPPPLLDVDTPPPLAAAWSAGGAATAQTRTSQAHPDAGMSTYTVRDGDDLTGIAVRLYGHAGGAQAIWSVNRDRLSSPDVLPIGLELRIPPAWSVPAIQSDVPAGQVIEPGRRPMRVRVAPGETLDILAQRFYGDRGMAAQLFEANRDQLRNPALVVAGMELRLP